MITTANFKKYKYLFLTKVIKTRLILINFIILVSLSFVIIKNIEEIRYSQVSNESGEIFVLDRFTSKIKVNK